MELFIKIYKKEDFMFELIIDRKNIEELIRCMNILNKENSFNFESCYEETRERWFFCINVRPKHTSRQWDIFVRVIGKDLIKCETEFYALINKNILRIINYDIIQKNIVGFFRLVKIID